MARLFVGVWPSAEVVAALAQRPQPQHPGVRWVPSQQWHVTLAFLGNADPDRVAEALDDFEHEPVTATLGTRVGRLGRGVLMVPVTGVESLAAAVRQRVGDLGSWRETQPFLGHLTLARLKNVAACPWATPLEAPLSWAVDHVEVVASDLTANGPRYTIVASLPLSR